MASQDGMAGKNLFARVKTRVISTLGYCAIRCVGASLRWRVVGWDRLEAVYKAGKRPILAFWHGRIFLASYYFRNRGIVVMTSRHRDGDYIAEVIRRLGYEAARGSSTRGGHGATRAALEAVSGGKDIGFAIDGPRGPRYVAKRGATYIAWKSGHPVVPFGVSAQRRWTLGSWDHFQIPAPFSRALVEIGEPIYVDAAAPKERLAEYDRRLQRELDALRDQGY
ncbi:MAG: lysophospholipid acyltransferase family protein [Acidobacteriota bacterium]|nr:lysophospholipid acyltransferase family protein [Acidobacteriota bacterium]